MPKFKFVGDPADDWSGPKSIDAFGLTFTRGEFTDVPPEVASKLAGNDHFEADDAASPAPAKRKGGWPAGKPRKPKEAPPELIEEAPAGEDDDEQDEAA